jgi:hypothetical protein
MSKWMEGAERSLPQASVAAPATLPNLQFALCNLHFAIPPFAPSRLGGSPKSPNLLQCTAHGAKIAKDALHFDLIKKAVMRILLALLSALALAHSQLHAACCYFSAKNTDVVQPAKNVHNDESLLRKVKKAVELRLTRKEVEGYVGVKPSFSAAKGEEAWIRLLIVDLGKDPDYPDANTLPVDGVQSAVFWVRPTGTVPPRLVGIWWNKNGDPRIFFSRVLPR